MSWFAFKNDGSVYDLNGLAETEMAATLAHGYPTQALAIANANAAASPDQAALLAQFQEEARSPLGGGALGVLQIANVNSSGKQTSTVSPPGILGTIKGGVGAVESAATAIPDLVSRLTSGALWVRIAEVVLGLVLIAVGVAELTHAVPIATKIAKRVGSTAALAAL